MWAGDMFLRAGFALGPAAAMVALRGAQSATGLGLVAVRAAQREWLRAGFEALECLEDVVAEARAGTARSAASAAAGATTVMPPVEVIALRARAGGTAAVPRPVAVAVEHAGPARLRLRPRGPEEAEALALIAEPLARFPGVRRAGLRPLTGSLVLETETAGHAMHLAEALERAGLVALARVHFPHPAAVATRLGLDRIDLAIRLRSGGRQDLLAALGRMIATLEARGPLGRRP